MDFHPAATDTVIDTARDAIDPGTPARWTLGARLTGGLLLSGASTGVLAGAEGWWRRGAGPAITVDAAVHRPLGLPSTLRVFETAALVGATWARPLTGERLTGELGAGLGILFQGYRYADASGATDQGDLWDTLASGHAGLSYLLAAGIHVDVQVGAWLTLHTRTHETVHGVVWRGPRLRPFLAAGLGL